MTDYDALFDTTAPTDTVFADKRAVDPLATPDAIRGRETQQRALARILGGVDEGYLPATVTSHGPPGTGKTVTTPGSVRSSPPAMTRWPSSTSTSRSVGRSSAPPARSIWS